MIEGSVNRVKMVFAKYLARPVVEESVAMCLMKVLSMVLLMWPPVNG